MRIRSSLRLRLVTLILVASVPAFGTIVYLANEERRQAGEDAQARAFRVARTFAAEHESRIESARQLLIALVEIPAVHEVAEPACSEAIAAVKRASPAYYANLGVLRPSGEGACSALPPPEGFHLEDFSAADVPGFARAATGEFTVTGYVFGPVARRPVIGVGYPIRDAAGAVRAIAYASLDLSWLSRRAYEERLPDGATITAIDPEGRVILHAPDPGAWLGTKLDRLPLVQAVRSQPAGGTVEAVGLDGTSRLYGHVAVGPVDAPYGHVALGIASTVAYAESGRLLRRGLMGLAIAFLLVLGVAWFGTDLFVLRRLRPVMCVVERVGQGDFTARTGTAQRDELAALADAVDGMAASLQRAQTEAQHSNAALRASEALVRTVADSSPVGIFMAAPDGRPLYTNPAIRTMLDATDQALHERWRELVHPDDREEVFTAWAEFVAGERDEYEIEHRFVTMSPGERHVHVQAAPVRAGSQLLGFVGNVQDITERKRAEAELRRHRESLEELVEARTAALAEANKELEAFSYSVSHDLRAPLRAVGGFAEMLGEESGDQLGAHGRHCLSRIQAGTERMGKLIDDMLKLAGVAGQEMRLERVDLSEMARDVGTELRERYPGRAVELIVPAGVEVNADYGLMRVALTNLLDNAWKYTSTQAAAHVEFGAQVKGGELECFVRDDGVGFDMSQAVRLFGPFQRLHSAAEFPGTGIGLATVAWIVRRHGGRVWAESTPGTGATFHFTLPGSSVPNPFIGR